MTEHEAAIVAVPERTPMDLIALALEKDLDPDRLEKLMALQERWMKHKAEEAYNVALNKVQAELPVVVKDAQNQGTGSWYARLESIQRKARPVFTSHGFSLSFGEEDSPKDGWKRTICDVIHIGGHSKRYHVDLPLDGVGPKGNAIGGMNAVQGTISTTSYAQRRLLTMIGNITIADEDIDGQMADDGEVINGTEQDEILAYLGKSDKNMKLFLNWASKAAQRGIETLDQLPKRLFKAAISQLQDQKKRREANQ